MSSLGGRCARGVTMLPALVVVLFSSAAPSHASQNDPPAEPRVHDLLVDRIEVQRVVVDLVAERDGRPVVDLEASEIRVFEDDTEVEFTFSPPPGRGAHEAQRPAETEPAGTADAGVVPRSTDDTLIVFLDELHLQPFHRKKVLQQARSVAEEILASGARVSVVAFDGRMRLVLEPTRDVKQLRRVLDEEAKSERTAMMAALADPARVIPVIHQRMVDETQERGGGSAARPSGNDPCIDVGGIARSAAMQAAAVVEQSLGGLRLLVGTLSRYEGRKTLLHVSDGIPLIPGMEAYTYAIEMCDGTAARQGVPNAVDTREFPGGSHRHRWDPRKARTEMMDFDTTRAWKELAAYANALQVSIYPIDATGLRGHANAGVSNVRTTMTFAQAAEGNPRDSLFLLAEETGGEAFFNTNRFGDALAEAGEDRLHTYQLSFRPTSTADGTRDIRVEVSRPGLELRHRKSFTTRTAASQLVDYAMSGLLFGRDENPLAISLTLGEPVSEDGETKVSVKVHVPLENLALVPVGADRVGRFTVAVGGQQSNGRYLPIGFKEIDVRASEVDQSTKSFEYEVEVPYRSKGVKLSVAVRDDVGGVEALRLAEV